jgi:hypothetical protein
MDGRYECHSRDGRFENATLFRKVSFRVKTRLLRTEGGSTLVLPDFSDSYGNYRQAFIEYLWAWLQIAGRNSARILIVDNRIWYLHRWDRQKRNHTRGSVVELWTLTARGSQNTCMFDKQLTSFLAQCLIMKGTDRCPLKHHYLVCLKEFKLGAKSLMDDAA